MEVRGRRGVRRPHVCDSEVGSVRRAVEGGPEEGTAASSAPRAAESANSAGGQSPTCAWKTLIKSEIAMLSK